MTSPGEKTIRDIMATPIAVAFPGGGGDCEAPADLDLRLAEFQRNDVGNAKRLMARHGADLLFVRELGWHIWDGTRWKRTGADQKARAFAHDTAAMIVAEAQAVQRAGPREYTDGSAEPVGDYRKRQDDLFGWGIQSGNRSKIEAMLVEAKPYLSVAPADLDADPMVLNLRNGTLRLEGACQDLRPHERGDLLSKIVDVEFDVEATCPRFHSFLARVQPNEDVRAFLQAFVGYCMTGDTSEQVMVFNYGTGANGKSTFVDTVAGILGPYAVSLPFASLLRDDRKRGADATPDLARLPGACLVRSSEPEKGSRFAEATIKAITGGEEITARNLHQGFFDFEPQFKLMVSGNSKPAIRGQDEGIWRRLLLVPWDVSIPREEWDLELDDTLRRERSGILNWMLDGCRRWLEDRLVIPDAVRNATNQYRTDSDPIGRFLKECVTDAPGGAVLAADLYRAYTAWCGASAEKPWGMKAFGMALTERGLIRHKSSIVKYRNIVLINVPAGGTEE